MVSGYASAFRFPVDSYKWNYIQEPQFIQEIQYAKDV